MLVSTPRLPINLSFHMQFLERSQNGNRYKWYDRNPKCSCSDDIVCLVYKIHRCHWNRYYAGSYTGSHKVNQWYVCIIICKCGIALKSSLNWFLPKILYFIFMTLSSVPKGFEVNWLLCRNLIYHKLAPKWLFQNVSFCHH